jgi:hypothetical protein
METNTASPQEKTSGTNEANESSVAAGNNIYDPSESEIRHLAEIIYHLRTTQGESGTAEEDWLKAESQLRDADINWF